MARRQKPTDAFQPVPAVSESESGPDGGRLASALVADGLNG